MLVYDYYKFPKERKGIHIDIINFLTTKESSGIYLACPIYPERNVYEKDLKVVNYGIPATPSPDIFPLRGIQIEENPYVVYIIHVYGKILKEERRYILGDQDKIRERVVFEGTIGNIINEFRDKGFLIK